MLRGTEELHRPNVSGSAVRDSNPPPRDFPPENKTGLGFSSQRKNSHGWRGVIGRRRCGVFNRGNLPPAKAYRGFARTGPELCVRLCVAVCSSGAQPCGGEALGALAGCEWACEAVTASLLCGFEFALEWDEFVWVCVHRVGAIVTGVPECEPQGGGSFVGGGHSELRRDAGRGGRRVNDWRRWVQVCRGEDRFD
jgi:hypothetical protein